MSILERERRIGLPPPPPPESGFWEFHEREFRPLPIERYPKAHLVGRVTLEDRVAAAEARLEQGLSLDGIERDLLALSHEYIDYGYDEDINRLTS